MKKAILPFMALAFVANADLVPTQTSLEATTTLTAQQSQALMATAVMPQGSIENDGTNLVVVGVAKIVIPYATADALATPPAGFSSSNLTSGSFKRDASGFVISVTLTK